jgi:hypothetical protein
MISKYFYVVRAQGMSKKRAILIEQLMGMITKYDPDAQTLALERFLNGHQLYNSRTHRLREGIRDLAQARLILLIVEELGKACEKTVWLSKDEKKLLEKSFENNEPRDDAI